MGAAVAGDRVSLDNKCRNDGERAILNSFEENQLYLLLTPSIEFSQSPRLLLGRLLNFCACLLHQPLHNSGPSYSGAITQGMAAAAAAISLHRNVLCSPRSYETVTAEEDERRCGFTEEIVFH